MTDLERQTDPKFRGPAYRYIRESDKLPKTDRDQHPPIAKVKLFDPSSQWTWYITSYDPSDRIAYGLVHGFEWEYGPFGMDELVSVRGRFGLPLERDLHWVPRSIDEIKEND